MIFARGYTEVVDKSITMESALLANEGPTRGKRGNSRSVYSWVLGAFLGAVLTFVLLGALASLSTGLGLFAPDRHFARRTYADQRGSADRGPTNSTTPTTGNRELHHGQDYFR